MPTPSRNDVVLNIFAGECITVQGRDCEADEIPEIVARLHAVTSGCGTRELSLRRNAVGQLGFHVQPVSLHIISMKMKERVETIGIFNNKLAFFINNRMDW